uniref:LIM zinc-binding domain-containing protein n=1 Tax=Magallana gigas TaxID=29159 RepID=A0A8W8JI70_MAGGI
MDGALYCEKDYEQRFAPTCAKCVKAIKETYLNAIQNTYMYHPDCFNCYKCRQSIDNNHLHLEMADYTMKRDFQTCKVCKRFFEDGDGFVMVKCHNCSTYGVNFDGQAFYEKKTEQ